MLTTGFTDEEIIACKRARTVICIKSVVLYETTRKVFRAGVEYEILSADWLWMVVRNDEGKPHSMDGMWFREHFIAGPAVVVPDSPQSQPSRRKLTFNPHVILPARVRSHSKSGNIMRGLHARTQIAIHRVQVAIGIEECVTTDSLLNAIQTAHSDGGNDALAGNNEPPAMFTNEPILLAAWEAGQETIFTLQEVNVCSGCRSHSGDPCPHHG